jgi:hypothetical protein
MLTCVMAVSFELRSLVGQSTAHLPRVNFMSTRNLCSFSKLSGI